MSDSAAQIELLRQARVHNLLKEWAGPRPRRLTLVEIAEIRAVLPDFDPQPPGLAPAAGDDLLRIPSADPAILQPAAVEAEASADQIARWEAIYGSKRRQLFRYLATGRDNHDPCPLDDPLQMPAWWSRNMHQRCPAKIINAAQAVRQTTAEAPPPAAADGAAPSLPGAAATVDLDDTTLDDGEEVRIARSLVKTYRDKLAEVIKDPHRANEIAQWDTRLKDALKTLKDAKTSDREAKKSADYFIPRGEVEMQVFGLLKLLKAMRDNMEKRFRAEVRARFPDMPELQVEALIAILAAERSREDEIFRDLSSIKAPDDVFRLAA